jgi:hypothetical protein
MDLKEEDVLLVLSHKKLKKMKEKKRNHKVWIHPILNSRQECGMFYTAFNDLINDKIKYFYYIRMPMAVEVKSERRN